jgi:hypothetical protein
MKPSEQSFRDGVGNVQVAPKRLGRVKDDNHMSRTPLLLCTTQTTSKGY